MEAFESFVAIALEAEGFVVSEAVKFPVTQQTAKSAYAEVQTHGFEVDLVAARGNSLVLATVKSAFGSRGVVAEHVTGESGNVRANKLYALLNNEAVRDAVVDGAAQRFGYQVDQVELRLYAGRFAAPTTGRHEKKIRQWCAEQQAGSGPIRVFSVTEVVAAHPSQPHRRRPGPTHGQLKVRREEVPCLTSAIASSCGPGGSVAKPGASTTWLPKPVGASGACT
ncbi:hypothetical protein AB0D32_28045 [Micromonospora sp. NPDC048170]|uniref:hypothetical protein n=1 Tax=Micromonospora sp. NPDC048170 TaxID=3154819 RepID=UPI0033C1812D